MQKCYRFVYLWWLLRLIWSFVPINSGAQAEGHPRGMIIAAELREIRQKANGALYSNRLERYEKRAGEQVLTKEATIQHDKPYEAVHQVAALANLYALTGKHIYADKAAEWCAVFIADTVVFHNPLSKGLTRAALLKSLATAYDFCYDAWQPTFREKVSRTLFETARSMHAMMGPEANYALESNWMGVRYATALYALMVCDFKGKSFGRHTEADPLEWDIRERLRDHISANMNPNGWSGESLGYHYYSWSFIAPALMAFEHRVVGRGKALPMLAPYCLNAIPIHATLVAYIRGADSIRAVKPDFSDDNISVRPEFFMEAFRLYPTHMHSALRWIVDAIGEVDSEEAFLFRLAWYPHHLPAENPGNVGWLHALELSQGAVGFRNRFKDEHDVVAAFTTTARRIRAHQSGDNLSFRIMGLDNIWVVGGGRTGLRAGQPVVFPTDTVAKDAHYVGGAIGRFLRYGREPGGSGFAIGKGSCMGVQNHERLFRADFDTANGAVAAFVVHDRSDNGRLWRLTTPEWNKVKALSDGFLLTGPNGSPLRATVVRTKRVLLVKTETVAYNGTTRENAAGIPYKGKRFPNITAVDIPMDKDILVVLTLQQAGKAHPSVSLAPDGTLRIGRKEFAQAAWE